MIALNKKLVLGSKSPRRAALLREMGFDFRVLVTEADENAPDHLNGTETAVWISEQKAKALQPTLSEDELGITSDTEVWLGNRRYGKPTSLDHNKYTVGVKIGTIKWALVRGQRLMYKLQHW